MSRAINLALSEEKVRIVCENSGISISSIEPLPSGGTHLVCTNGEGAEEVRQILNAEIIQGAVRRYSFYRSSGPW